MKKISKILLSFALVLLFNVSVSAEHVRNTSHHVLYRVTPVYEGNNLLCDGVQIEACCIEENGGSINFNVFCYNVQPWVDIDYATGKSKLSNHINVGK